jgi:putative PEP-CTERM system histidine kinase
MDIGLVSYSAAALAFLALTLVLLAGWKGRPQGVPLVVASVATSVWAAASAYAAWRASQAGAVVHVLEVLRSGAWIAFLFVVLPKSGHPTKRRLSPVMLRIGALVLVVVLIGFDIASLTDKASRFTQPWVEVVYSGGLLLSVLGLALVENLFRNTRPDHRWAIKFLCFGVGALFAYDLYLYSNALLFHRLDPVLMDARGLANALVVPLIAVSAARNPEWSLDVFVSRKVVFHSTALVAGGIYLLMMAVAGYYLRISGGEWGPMLRVTFLTGAAILLLMVLFSGRVRARLKVLVNKHFFTYKYDYREEWLRFIRTIASTERGFNLRNRVIQSVADIIDSPGGALWLGSQDGRLSLSESWNFAGPAEIPADSCPLIRFLEAEQSVLDLNDVDAHPHRYQSLEFPNWLREMSRAWLVLPLIHNQRLIGLMVLSYPRAPKELNWEDHDLLNTVGQQVASYLAEQEAAEALAEARQFEVFNRRLAFIIHDIKNVVSELSLVVSNAVKHSGNPAFHEDMLRTVEESVGRMNRLLFKLKSDRQAVPQDTSVELAPLLRDAVKQRFGAKPAVSLECQDCRLEVRADEDRLHSVLGHLIQNALEAVSDDGHVQVRLRADQGSAMIEVEDDGPGMDAEFIRNVLFRPFRTTKHASFGIGLYESREYARQLGGGLEIQSRRGHGTIVRLSLPIRGAGSKDQDQLPQVTAK